MSTMAHEVCCPICKALPMDCRCSLESLLKRAGRGYLGQSASGPQQTMTSLREMRESLAALVTEFRGLREDQQRLNGLLLERLTNIDQKFSGVYGGQDALAVAFNRNTGDLGESAMRNHCQVMDALDRYFGELKKLYGKLNYNVEQRRGKRRK